MRWSGEAAWGRRFLSQTFEVEAVGPLGCRGQRKVCEKESSGQKLQKTFRKL